jgi:hypothetical protein
LAPDGYDDLIKPSSDQLNLFMQLHQRDWCIRRGLPDDAGTKSVDADFSLFTSMPELRATMKIQKIYSALLTTDLAAAESWYTKLLGRGPDYRPMETLIQWDLFPQGGLQLATDDNLAGNGALFLLVGDVATERQRLRDLDIR